MTSDFVRCTISCKFRMSDIKALPIIFVGRFESFNYRICLKGTVNIYTDVFMGYYFVTIPSNMTR